MLGVDQFKGACIQSEVQVRKDLVSVKDGLIQVTVSNLSKELLFLCKIMVKTIEKAISRRATLDFTYKKYKYMMRHNNGTSCICKNT